MIWGNHFLLESFVYEGKSIEHDWKPFPSICHQVKVYWNAISMILMCTARNAMAKQLVERHPNLSYLTEHHLGSGSQWVTWKAHHGMQLLPRVGALVLYAALGAKGG